MEKNFVGSFQIIKFNTILVEYRREDGGPVCQEGRNQTIFEVVDYRLVKISPPGGFFVLSDGILGVPRIEFLSYILEPYLLVLIQYAVKNEEFVIPFFPYGHYLF